MYVVKRHSTDEERNVEREGEGNSKETTMNTIKSDILPIVQYLFWICTFIETMQKEMIL